MVLLKAKYGIVLIACAMLLSCKHKPAYDGRGSAYPEAVGKIILDKCATTGCHNSTSHKGAGGLNLTSWYTLFEGGSIGTSVIPYSSKFSTLCYYTNTDTSLGVTLTPTMPVNQAPLTKEEYLTLKHWVDEGAPNINGAVKYADEHTRSKVYVTNRLCDVVTVFDSRSLLQMRYVDVGISAAEEFPVTIKVSPDKQYWYVSFFAQSEVVQKYSAVDDRWIGDLHLGLGSWTSFAITQDSRYGYFVDNTSKGKVVYVDLFAMKVLATYDFGGRFSYMSGIVINEARNKLYIGTSFGNFIYSIDITNPLSPIIKEIPIDGSGVVQNQPVVNPTDFELIPSSNKCYVACQQSKDIKVIDMETDSILSTIALDTYPAFMSYSAKTKKLFVSCPDDEQSFAGNRGAIAIVDTEHDVLYKRLDSGYQPYGLSVDDERGIVAIANANFAPGGDEPHHSSDCEGRNGNVTFIDLNTLELVKINRSEVAVYPFGVATR
ncbi:MAG: hypothetical protein R2800_13260 [Flavipsychrobacter sp.]